MGKGRKPVRFGRIVRVRAGAGGRLFRRRRGLGVGFFRSFLGGVVGGGALLVLLKNGWW